MRAPLWAALVLSGACASTPRVQRHASWDAWRDGFTAQAADPWQLGPELTLLAAIPVAAIYEDEIREATAGDDTFTHDGEHVEDTIAEVLTATPLALGLFDWARGDSARAFEVAAESALLTMGTTHVLKDLTERQRPDDSGDQSFPSGHTSRAFMGATFVGRWVDARYDSRLGYLAYAPAAAVGLARLQHDSHWATDVAAGALLGTVLTNWIWNAHYGPAPSAIYEAPPKVAWTVVPVPLETGFALSLTLSL